MPGLHILPILYPALSESPVVKVHSLDLFNLSLPTGSIPTTFKHDCSIIFEETHLFLRAMGQYRSCPFCQRFEKVVAEQFVCFLEKHINFSQISANFIQLNLLFLGLQSMF